MATETQGTPIEETSSTKNDYMDYKLGMLLNKYGCTLSTADQSRLRSIIQMDSRTNRILRYNPFLFGKDYDYRVLPRIEDGSKVLTQYKHEMLARTIEEFPIDLKLDVNHQYPDNPKVYDARYVLICYYHLLAPTRYINCEKFISHLGLSFTLIATTSQDERMRQLAYIVLTRFYQHLQSARHYVHAKFWTIFLDIFRCSLRQEYQQIPFTLGYFLVMQIDLFLKPTQVLFAPFRNFLCSEYRLDYSRICPFFLSLLNIQDVEEWRDIQKAVTKFFATCMRTEEDFKLFAEAQVPQFLFTLYLCDFCQTESRTNILEFVLRCTSYPEAVNSVCVEGCLIPWLNKIIGNRNRRKHPSGLSLIDAIMSNIRHAFNSDYKFHESVKAEAILLMNRFSYISPQKSERTKISTAGDN